MTILVIHHTLGVTWINIAPESIRKSYHYIRAVNTACASQGARNKPSSVATCSSIGARSRLTIRCSGARRATPLHLIVKRDLAPIDEQVATLLALFRTP